LYEAAKVTRLRYVTDIASHPQIIGLRHLPWLGLQLPESRGSTASTPGDPQRISSRPILAAQETRDYYDDNHTEIFIVSCSA
jgi:hypothetical protein